MSKEVNKFADRLASQASDFRSAGWPAGQLISWPGEQICAPK